MKQDGGLEACYIGKFVDNAVLIQVNGVAVFVPALNYVVADDQMDYIAS